MRIGLIITFILIALVLFWLYKWGGLAETVKEVRGERPMEVAELEIDEPRHISINNLSMTSIKRIDRPIMIDYEMFKELITNLEFIELYTRSAKRYIDWKLNRYASIYNESLEEKKQMSAPKDSRLDPRQGLKDMMAKCSSIVTNLEQFKKELNVAFVRNSLKEAIWDKKRGAESIRGRGEILDSIAATLYAFAQDPCSFYGDFHNYALYGDSGIGKSRLAETMAFVFSKSCLLCYSSVHKITKKEITTPYVNGSSDLMRAHYMGSLESVLFWDEAYDIGSSVRYMGNARDHGEEAVTEFVYLLDRFRGLNVCVVAGYEAEMEEKFMGSNQGMRRRFPNVIRLRPYDDETMLRICVDNITERCRAPFTGADVNYMYSLIAHFRTHENVHLHEVFSHHASDAINFGNILSRIISSSHKPKWGDSMKGNCSIINEAMYQHGLGKGVDLSSILIEDKDATVVVR